MPDTRYYDLVPKDLDQNLAYRREILKMAGADPSVSAEVKSMCGRDLLFYINVFGWTYDPRNAVSVIPFVTYDFQDGAMMEIADCIIEGRDYAMPKSRDMGASWMGLSVFEWFWHFKYDQSFLLVSRNEDYVDKSGNPKSLFWKIDFLHRNEPRWLLPEGRWLGGKDPQRKLLHLGNAETGSVLDGESTTGDAGRGDRRTAMFIDEHAAFDINDGFRVLRATRDTTRCRGFNSTPQGANNGFYEVCHNTSARVIRLHWSQHPDKARGLYRGDPETGKIERHDDWRGVVEVRAKGEKDGRKVIFPDEYPFKADGKLRSPWYDGECARCVSEMEIGQELDIDFLGSDYQFFDAETIEILRKKHCRPPDLVGDLEFDPESCEPKRFTENPKGKLLLWMTLDGEGRPAKNRKFVVGADVSAGTGASNSVASAADEATGEKVAVWRDPNTRPNPFAKTVIALAKWLNRGMLDWDASGPTGDIFTKRVIESGYGNIYYRRNEKKIGRNISDQPGSFLNPAEKTSLFEDYREALASSKYINRSEQGMKECLQFVRKSDGTIEHSAAANAQDPSGARTAHGDEAVADALASLLIGERHRKPEQKEPEIPPGCLAWRRQQRSLELAAASADGLGSGW